MTSAVAGVKPFCFSQNKQNIYNLHNTERGAIHDRYPKITEFILELLKKVKRELGVTILLITHQMKVIKNICIRMVVMVNCI